MSVAPGAGFDLQTLAVRQAQEADLAAMEWGGDFSHFRRLFRQVYDQMQAGQALIWIADLPQQAVVGQLFIQLVSARKDFADGKTRAYLYGFRIRPPYRNLGIGTHMMAVVEGDLAQRGLHWLTLNVTVENAGAIRLYERLGYTIVAAEEGNWSYIDQFGRQVDVHEPSWRMEKALNQS
jgi:ribosomal protein S18 acetylase RimI-like enzyme